MSPHDDGNAAPLRALPSIAVLLSGHFRDTLESAGTTAPLQRFLAQCDRSSSHYALFVHTWNRTEPVTTTYYKAARRAAASVDVTRLVQLLQPAGLRIEHQTIASSAMHEKWALSGMTVAGIKAAIYSMRVAARMADEHVARHGFAPFDVYVRVRPDMYRLRQGGSLPRCVVSCCFNATVDGALYTAEATPGGVRERGDVGGGDNFVWARPHVWSQVLYHWDTRFAAISEATWQWNKHNPEAMVAQAAQELGFRSLGCGGLAPGMRGECAAACDESTRLPPVHFVNFAVNCVDAMCRGDRYEERQAGWASSAVSVGRADQAKAWTPRELYAVPAFARLRREMVERLGQAEASFRGGNMLWKPFIILEALKALPEGGFVVYADVARPGYMALSGRQPLPYFRRSLRPLIDWLNVRRDQLPVGLPGIYLDLPNSFHQTWFASKWRANNMVTRRPEDVPLVLRVVGIAPEQAPRVLNAWHLQDSWSVWRKCDLSVSVLEAWLNATASREMRLVSIVEQTWIALLAVKHQLAAPSGRAFGLGTSVVGGQSDHVDPNRLKDINVMLEALESQGRLRWMWPNEPHPAAGSNISNSGTIAVLPA
jgi:hypothetical protein